MSEEQVVNALYERTNDLRKPRAREIRRRDDRQELINTKSEVFFGTKKTITFTDGTGSTVNHNTTDLVIRHDLRSIPDDVIVGIPTSNAVVRKGQGKWTTNQIFLRCNSACSVTIYLVK